MADFSVNTDALQSRASEIQRVQRELNAVAARLAMIQISRALKSNSSVLLSMRIRDCNAAVANQSGNLRKLANGLDAIADMYNRTENDLSDPKTDDEGLIDRLKDILFAVIFPWGDYEFPRWVTDWPALIAVGVGAALGSLAGGGFPDSGSVISGGISGNGDLWGIPTAGELEYSLLGYEIDTIAKAEWDLENGDAGIKYGGGIDIYGARGSASGNVGILGGSVEASAGNAGVSGSINATLFEDGKFTPSIGAEVNAEASVLKGKAEGHLGSEDTNIHAEGSGTLLGAEAGAEAKAGVITTRDPKTGETVTSYGVSAEASAEAYLAEGEISGGISIFGLEIDVGVSGKAGGAGVEAGGSVTTNGASGKIGAGLGVGAGVEISVDWSDFDPPSMEEIGEGLCDVGEAIGDKLEDAGDAIVDFFTW